MSLSVGLAKKSKKSLKGKHIGDGAIPTGDGDSPENLAGIFEAQSIHSPTSKRHKKKKALKEEYICDSALVTDGGKSSAELAEILEARLENSSAPKRHKKVHGDMMQQSVVDVICPSKKHRSSNKNRKMLNVEQESKVDDSKGEIFASENQQVVEEAPNKCETSWLQKASWKSLVGESGRVAFSLQTVVGIDNRSKARVEQPSTEVGSGLCREGTSSFHLTKFSNRSNSYADSVPVNKELHASKLSKLQDTFESSIQQSVGVDAEEDHSKESAECGGQELSLQNLQKNSAENVCRFMRSENYEQEWLVAKRAAKEEFKRSRKDAVKSMKMFHTRNTT